MKRIRYEIDPHNRLIAKGGRRTGFPKFRKVLDGRFKTAANNSLTYHVKAPLSKDETIPHQVRLKGRWSLTDSHDLELVLDKSERETFGDRIILQGEILDAKANSLLFAVTTKTKEGAQSTYTLNLEGSWKADENNRLTFQAKREKDERDILTFGGAWQINKNHEILYQYEKADLIRKRKRVHALAFKGHWDIEDKLRISYVLDRNTESAFDFRASAGVFKEGYIKYELGIGLARRPKPVKRTIALFGAWKIKKDTGLLFEIEYERAAARAIVFGAEAKLTNKDTILFRLKNDIENKDIGVELELSHKILKGDGEAFLRLLKSRPETAIYAGAAWRW